MLNGVLKHPSPTQVLVLSYPAKFVPLPTLEYVHDRGAGSAKHLKQKKYGKK